ncbi:hypothetical protein CSKR_203913 [Clonorchis sinensis]|uniref:Reverse transcriptase domain-containing protein n=1 Tax=Clonorchis sinensis TaxID=79923 RepID=A0A8T1M009_CLOSI|nr:hypothetical protein CSKR_203913 [Clonorchis sinensis]
MPNANALKMPESWSRWVTPHGLHQSWLSKSQRVPYSTGLNTALDSHHYPLQLPDDIFAKMNGGAYFAKLDLSEAYLQVEVAEESRHLLTINTRRGLFEYTRLPFGVKTAPSIFQQIMDTMLCDLTGVVAYLHDIIVVGATKEDLPSRLDAVLQRLNYYGFRLKKEKCEFLLNFLKYLGFIIDKNGRRPDPSNIDPIVRMPPPSNVAELKSFLGLTSYYSAFLPIMRCLREPFNQLLTKGCRWDWSRDCQLALEEVKRLLQSELLLMHFSHKICLNRENWTGRCANAPTCFSRNGTRRYHHSNRCFCTGSPCCGVGDHEPTTRGF